MTPMNADGSLYSGSSIHPLVGDSIMCGEGYSPEPTSSPMGTTQQLNKPNGTLNSGQLPHVKIRHNNHLAENISQYFVCEYDDGILKIFVILHHYHNTPVYCKSRISPYISTLSNMSTPLFLGLRKYVRSMS